MSSPAYRPRWPETIVFIGAGATRALGMHTTDDLGRCIFHLGASGGSLASRVGGFLKVANDLSVYHQDVHDFLILLGDTEDAAVVDMSAVFDRQYPGIPRQQVEQRVEELRRKYDWCALLEVIRVSPSDHLGGGQLQDLFDILDMHISNGHGFHVSARDENDDFVLLDPARLVAARDALKLLCMLLHKLDYQKAIISHTDIVDAYASFADVLADLMQEEGVRLHAEGRSLTQRDFYLFSHAFICMNWDPIFLWAIFNAHKNRNDSPTVPNVGQVPEPMKLFHDMGHFMGFRKIDGEGPGVWYPFNETVVQRVNDETHHTGRRVRVGKFYFPHGSSAWRECPKCGKLTVVMGSSWDMGSRTLFPPLPFASLCSHDPRSREEEKAHERGRFDVVQCPFCGTLTESRDTPIVMQTSFKGAYPPFVEEIQRDMKVAIENAQHIVLLGYSLPLDDTIYRSILSARKNRDRPLYCSIIVNNDQTAPDAWMTGDELESYVEYRSQKDGMARAYGSCVQIFGREHVRGYARGIPQVFLSTDRMAAEKGRVIEMLYPEFAGFINGQANRTPKD